MRYLLIQEQLAALSAPPLQTQKDNTTEGEKETQEKDQAGEGKGKELATIQGKSSFSKLLEEGEIDEPYVPEYVDGVFTTEEAQIDNEEDSSLVNMPFIMTVC